MSKRSARVLLSLIGLIIGGLIGYQWGTNDAPLLEDLARLVALFVICFVVSAFAQRAMNALNRKDDDR